MRRPTAHWAALAVVVACSLAVPVRAVGETFGILRSKDIQIYSDTIVGFKTNCNGEYLEYDMDEDFEKGAAMAAEINSADPDVLFVLGTRAAIAAQQNVNSSIPIVFSLVLDPEKADIEAPNVTGVKMEIPVRTQLETLQAIVPKVKKIGVMFNPKKSGEMVRAAAAEAKELGIQLVASRIERKEDALRALSVFAGGIDAFWLIPDPTVANAEVFPQLLRFTVQNRTPFFAFSEAFVKARALFSLSPDYAGVGRQACRIAKDLVAGKEPGEVPWQDPDGLKLSVNIKTAEQLGLSEISVNAFSYAAKKGYQIQPVQ